jgi:3',5'-cyclic AMP phosphodiesterase CpdA
VPGNHEYRTARSAPYYDYFGARAGPAGLGYYSFEAGSWHVVALNSSIPMHAGSPQERWLRHDLAAHRSRCTLAYWHHPSFSSGAEHGNTSEAEPVWRALYFAGADVVLAGHEHVYERFAPQTPAGQADSAYS